MSLSSMVELSFENGDKDSYVINDEFDIEKDKELMKYMQDLNNYYQLYGRPRFDLFIAYFSFILNRKLKKNIIE